MEYRASYQIDRALEETGGVQDLVHDYGLELIGVQLLPLQRHAVVQDHGERSHSRLLKIRLPFLHRRARPGQ